MRPRLRDGVLKKIIVFSYLIDRIDRDFDYFSFSVKEVIMVESFFLTLTGYGLVIGVAQSIHLLRRVWR